MVGSAVETTVSVERGQEHPEHQGPDDHQHPSLGQGWRRFDRYP